MELPVDLECPECGPDTPLAAPAGALRARACPRCAGALLGPVDVERLRALVAAPPDPPVGPLPDVRCPSCGDQVARVALAETPFAPCAACGAAWLGPGPLLRRAERRLAAPPPRAPAPSAGPPAHAPRRWRRVLAVAGVAAVAAGLAWIGLSVPPQVLSRLSPPPPSLPAAPAAVVTAQASSLPASIPAAEAAADVAAGAPAVDPVEPEVLLAPVVALGEVEAVPSGPGQPRVLLAYRPGRTASLLIAFAAGAVDDADLPGLTRAGQHALLEANGGADPVELALAVHAAGASLQMATGQREATFLLTADRRDFSRLAGLLSKALLEPRFLASRMPRVHARAVLDEPVAPDLLALVTALAAEDTRYINPAVGSRADVESITAADVARHLEGPLSPANATVVVAGAFDRDEILRLLHRARGGRASAPTRARLAVPFSARRASTMELHVLAHPTSIATPREAACARLAAELLHDVLWRQFRETGVGYSHQVTAYRRPWMDVLALALPARDTSTDLGPALRAAVERVREGRFTDRDLDRARGAVRGALLATDSDPAALARTLATGGVLWHGKELAADIGAIDHAAFLAIVRPWLDPESSVSLYVGPNP